MFQPDAKPSARFGTAAEVPAESTPTVGASGGSSLNGEEVDAGRATQSAAAISAVTGMPLLPAEGSSPNSLRKSSTSSGATAITHRIAGSSGSSVTCAPTDDPITCGTATAARNAKKIPNRRNPDAVACLKFMPFTFASPHETQVCGLDGVLPDDNGGRAARRHDRRIVRCPPRSQTERLKARGWHQTVTRPTIGFPADAGILSERWGSASWRSTIRAGHRPSAIGYRGTPDLRRRHP